MHQPRPYGRFAHGADLSEEDAARVEGLARSLSNFKDVSGLPSAKRTLELPNGRMAVAIDAGGTFRIVILEKQQAQIEALGGFAGDFVPMLFSGRIARDILRDGEGVQIKLTRQARIRLAGYDLENLPPEQVELQRFAIEYPIRHSYLKPEDAGIFKHTQYRRLRPTWFSGAMAQVVQVVGGYGKQDLKGLPESKIERARMILPTGVMKKINTELSGMRLPGYSGLPPSDGEIQYEYLHTRCNLVAFDSESAPWLVRVQPAGVHVMPLPMIPATTTEAFREYVIEKNDEELLTVLDRFGGLPSGESFPDKTEDFEAWRRAGVIIKVCDTSGFFEGKSAMYQACGWSANSKGTEAFNTCWDFDGSGMRFAHGYKMRLTLGPAERRGMTPDALQALDDETRSRLTAYLLGLYKALGNNSTEVRAIKYKMRSISPGDLLARNYSSFQNEADYWRNYEAEPIASHSGSISRVSSGYAYTPGKNPKSMGALKFPALTAEGCESFDFTCPDYAGTEVRCDTIMHGFYVGDELNVVKYFRDIREFTEETESTFGPGMIVGSWEETTTTGQSGILGSIYTTAFDDRAKVPPVTKTTKITGTDKGYGEPAFHTPPLLFRTGSLTRNRYYKHKTETDETAGLTFAAAACVPVFSRDIVLYAYSKSISKRTWTMGTEMFSMADPNSYELWTHDSIFHYMGVTGAGNKGDPVPALGVPVYLDTLVYSPTEFSDFADGGNWYNLPIGGFLDITSICGMYTSRSSGLFNANGVTIGGAAPGFNPESSSKTENGKTEGRVSISAHGAGSVLVHSNVPSAFFFDFSPEDDLYFYRDASAVAIGSSQYVSVDEPDQYGSRSKWGYSALADSQSSHNFIGVINE